MSQDARDTPVSIEELPTIVKLLFEHTHRPLLPGAQKPLGLFVRYLRRKPGRGLAVIYNVDEIGNADRLAARDPYRAVSLTLDEKALDGPHICFSQEQAQEATLEVQPSGVLCAREIGLSVQAFPADGSLPALAVCCEPSSDRRVFDALQSAARKYPGNDSLQLISASAEPVRYKPANRCVIRYHLVLQPAVSAEESTIDTPRINLTLFGKVYAEPEQARSVQIMQQRLYEEQVQTAGSKPASQPFLPCSPGIVEELGLTLTEAVQPANAEERVVTGSQALRPAIIRGRGGEITGVIVPVEELQLTAKALARLHTSSVRPDEGEPRTGGKEAKRARERAALISSHNPTMAEEVQLLAQQLAAHLEALQPDEYRPAHGGFKASQLLFHSHQVFVVDFDGFCLADAALDVGYFLAYLRPSGLWYGRAGMRKWFEDAADVFIGSYRQAMTEHGVPEAAIDGILQRSRLYEAALLLKIATRRVNRLNSPRSGELSAMLREIAACLVEEAGQVSI
ncbi:MAG TPA: aminoglycoside phosphotransferase family protein [Ktedonobacteraceae bacterium]